MTNSEKKFLGRTNDGFDIFNKITDNLEGAMRVQDKVEEMTGERMTIRDAVRHLAFYYARFNPKDPNRDTIMIDQYERKV